MSWSTILIDTSAARGAMTLTRCFFGDVFGMLALVGKKYQISSEAYQVGYMEWFVCSGFRVQMDGVIVNQVDQLANDYPVPLQVRPCAF